MESYVSLLLFLSIIGNSHLSEAPQYENVFHLVETFDEDDVDKSFSKIWHHSTFKKDSTDPNSQLSLYQGKFSIGPEKDQSTNNNALIMNNTDYFKKFGIFRMLDKPFYFEDNFIVQYELSFQNEHSCGGAYLKLVSKDSGISDSNTDLNSDTPYTIMFGPDVCNRNYKFHFIFRHKNPITGEIEEKHMQQPNPSKYKHIFTDGKVHLLRLMTFKWDQSFVIELDNYIISRGNLLKDFIPSVNPDEFIDDIADVKPSDWDDRIHIVDPNDIKPDDWDEFEPEYIQDTSAVMPDDWNDKDPRFIDDVLAEKPAEWDDTIDGEWEPPKIYNPRCTNDTCGPWTAPTIKNPKYKGIFKPQMIKNPNYQGQFKPKKIKNPNFFNDVDPFTMMPIEAVAIEVVASPNVVTFDNIIVTNKADALMVFNSKHWKSKNAFNATAFFDQYKVPIIIGGFIIGSVIFVIIIAVKYSSTKDDTTTSSPSIDGLLKDDNDDDGGGENKPDINDLSDKHDGQTLSEEEHEASEEDPPKVLRRSNRRVAKKNIS